MEVSSAGKIFLHSYDRPLPHFTLASTYNGTGSRLGQIILQQSPYYVYPSLRLKLVPLFTGMQVKSFKTKHLTKVAPASFKASLMACSFDAYHTVSTLSLHYPTLGSFYFIYTLLITRTEQTNSSSSFCSFLFNYHYFCEFLSDKYSCEVENNTQGKSC